MPEGNLGAEPLRCASAALLHGTMVASLSTTRGSEADGDRQALNEVVRLDQVRAFKTAAIWRGSSRRRREVVTVDPSSQVIAQSLGYSRRSGGNRRHIAQSEVGKHAYAEDGVAAGRPHRRSAASATPRSRRPNESFGCDLIPRHRPRWIGKATRSIVPSSTQAAGIAHPSSTPSEVIVSIGAPTAARMDGCAGTRVGRRRAAGTRDFDLARRTSQLRCERNLRDISTRSSRT